MNSSGPVCSFSDGMKTLGAIMRAAAVIEAYAETRLASVNLSFAKQTALSHLVAAGEPLALSDIAQRLTCVRSNVTQLIDRLEADGLVQRVDHPSDRRMVRAELTPLGRERHAQGEETLRLAQQELMKRVPSKDAARLVELLQGIC
ncbi:MAG: MarR family winged helix-turn-helix transcriptional regulator [Gemmatimonadaceae bacterium]